MSTEMALRLSDAALALFWAWALLHTLRTGYIGPVHNQPPARKGRPALYWSMVFIMALMVLHFAGLAWVGQKI